MIQRIAAFMFVTMLAAAGDAAGEDTMLKPADVLRHCQVAKGPSSRPGYSAALKRPVCRGPAVGGMPEQFTINYAVVCWRTHKTLDFKFVDRGGKRYVQCLK
jgi:hypothetical protein